MATHSSGALLDGTAEIIRCLKRLLARELWAAMRPRRTPATTIHAAA
ncbi:MAG: hypothetical protein V9F04_08265 [Dermatophilaceae bacterium]